MVAIVPSYRLPAACFELARHEKSTSEAIKRIEKTGLTRAVKIAAEWHNAELRHFTQPGRSELRKSSGGTVQESTHGGSSKSN
jgi:hypothetical protein